MKSTRCVLTALIAAGLFGTSIANAQPPGRIPGHGHAHGHPHGERHGPMRHEARPGDDGRGPGASAYAPGHWRKGDRLPSEYRGRQYVIDDWRGYHLAPPPRGYHWVGVGGEYLMVRIGTGIVLQVGP